MTSNTINNQQHPASGQDGFVPLFGRYRGIGWCLALLGLVIATPIAQAIDFSGPALFEQTGTSLSALGVRVPGADRDYLVTGTGEGFLSLNRYNPDGEFYAILDKQFIGGELVEIIPWVGLPAQQPGIVVATANPDRVLFVEVNASIPYLVVISETPLAEDPGEMAFVGQLDTGPRELAVSLPGVDRVAFLALDGDSWSVYDEVASGDNPSSVVGIDMDGDQVRELVVAQTGPLSGTLGVFQRQPDLTYHLTTIELPGVLPALVSAHDVDGDGHDELVVARSDAEQVVIYNTSGGLLTEFGRTEVALVAESMLLATLPGSIPGLFVASGERGLVEVTGWDGSQWSPLGSYYPGCRPYSLAVADLDGDAIMDLIALDDPGEVFGTMIGNDTPGFLGFPAVSLDQSPGSFAVNDVDGDGLQDLLITNVNHPALTLFVGTAEGNLSRDSQNIELGFVPGYIQSVNMDGDPALELVALDILAGDLVILDYSSEAGVTQLSRTEVGLLPFYVISGDLDADQKMDLVLLTRDTFDVTVAFGEGDGTIAETVVFGFRSSVDRVLPIDLNADGLMDLVATDGLSRVWSMINAGGRAFGQETFINAGQGAFSMATGDLDGDLDDDLVVANRNEQTLSFFENNGSGNLVRRIGGHVVTGSPAGLVLADFDADGRQDVLVNLTNTGALSLVLGVANWGYAPATDILGGSAVIDIDAVDFNLDGVLDIMALDQSLNLGLMLINADPDLVAVAPTAVASECAAGKLLLRILPDRPGPWTVELGDGEHWWPVMVNGYSAVGEVDYDAGAWAVRLTAAQLAEVIGPVGHSIQVRLSIGQGDDRESQIWTAELDCLPRQATDVPLIRWRAEPWPNPFNPRVQARFSLGRPGAVTAGIYDLAGRLVTLLAHEEFAAGDHVLMWDGHSKGTPVAAGVYFLRVATVDGVLNHKLMMVK